MGMRLLLIAMNSGVMPFLSTACRSAPASSSTRAVSTWPSRAANISGVMSPGIGGWAPWSGRPPRTMPLPWEPQPVRPTQGMRRAGTAPARVRAWMSALCSSRTRTASVAPPSAAIISAVSCSCGAAMFGLTPRSSSARTASPLPDRVATISMVSPVCSTCAGLAPCSSSARIIGPLPLAAARYRAVTPRRFRAAASAPAFRRRRATSSSFARTAQCSARVPSLSEALTSSPRSPPVTSDRTRTQFPALAASDRATALAEAPTAMVGLPATPLPAPIPTATGT